MYNKILVPLDGSEVAEQVLPYVIDLARCTGGEIILLRTPAVPVYDYLVTEPQWGNEIRQEAEREAVEYLDNVSRQLTAKGLNVKTRVGSDGAVPATILDMALELSVDLIAMSTHGRSGLARLVMGSVADQVVRHSALPVLLVRPQPVHSDPHSAVHSTNLHQPVR